MLVGYARVSTFEQHLDLQVDDLRKAGCEKIYSDKISGITSKRAGLEEALSYMREGDTLVVWKLDRLGRTLKHLIQFIQDLQEKGIHFKSLKENIDTTSSTGKLIFHIFGALAEFERDIIIERTKAGLEAARARGRKGGRKPKLDSSKVNMALAAYEGKKTTVQEICKNLGVTKPTFYKAIRNISAK